MGAFMGYMLQASIIMTILYLVYKLLMSGLSFHSFNRKIILGIYTVSWILPAFTGLFTQTSEPSALVGIGHLEMISVIADDADPVKRFNWTNALAVIYLSGIFIMGVVTIMSIWRMSKIIRKGFPIESTDFSVKVSDRAPGAFSWGKYIIVRPSDLDESLNMVLVHETAHLRKRHWVDLIPSRITLILQWFSPSAWLLARELREVHEFEVDEIASGENIYEYQLMLIKKTAGSRFPVFADSLNHSQIKKRLTMMRKKSNPKRKVAAIGLPLAAGAAVLLLSQPVIAQVVDQLASSDLSLFASDKIKENDRALQIQTVLEEADRDKSSAISVTPSKLSPTNSADNEILYELLGKDESTETEVKPYIKSKLTYFVDGQEYKGSIADLDPSTIASMQVVKNDPAYPDSKVMITTKPADSASNKIEADAEKIAQFKGGEKELLSFLIENIKYPATGTEITDKPIRVILSFNIMTDGAVNDIKVLKSGGEVFDSEAIEVVKKTSGRWEPAENNGKPVVSQFTIPIIFQSKP